MSKDVVDTRQAGNAGSGCSEWISVTDAMPDEFVRVLIFSPNWPGEKESDKIRMAEWMKDSFQATDDGGWDTCNDVTHWMPLPNTPNTSAQRSLPSDKLTPVVGGTITKEG